MNRRDFLTTTTLLGTTAIISGCNDGHRVAIDYSKHPQKIVMKKELISIEIEKQQLS